MDPAIRTLIDKATIRDLAYTYSHAVDRRDYELLATCFTSDLLFTIDGAVYADRRDKFIYTVQGIERYHTTMHFNANHLSEISGDSATSETYTLACHFYDANGVQQEYLMGIRYLDELVRTDDRWRFRARRLSVDWTRGVGLPNPRSARAPS